MRGSTTFKDATLGLRAIEFEAECQYLRKGIYLQMHPQMKEALEAYQMIKKTGWRNPPGDLEHVLEKYKAKIDIEKYGNNYKKCCKDMIKEIKQKYYNKMEQEWTANLLYGRNVLKEGNKIKFPAYKVPNMDSWRLSVLNAAAEEQLHGLGPDPQGTKCIKGCNANENAYHVANVCPNRAFAARHDFVVYWTLKIILKNLGTRTTPEKPPVWQGSNTLSVQGWGKENRSYYYIILY